MSTETEARYDIANLVTDIDLVSGRGDERARERIIDAFRALVDDRRRLNALEAFVAREPLVLHDGRHGGFRDSDGHALSGLGMHHIGRTLRQAVDGSLLRPAPPAERPA